MASLNIAHYKQKFIDENRTIYEIKKSNDGLYVFICKLYLGTFNQIVWGTKMVCSKKVRFTQIVC